jgi:hypothetical protein
MADYKLSGEAVTKMANMWRASQRDNPTPGTPDKFRSQESPRYFYAQVMTTGPLGTEADYTDPRHWVQRVIVANNGGSATDAVTFTPATDSYALTVTATNMPDLANGAHSLKAGAIVRVDWEYDQTSPTPNVRYLIGQPINRPIVVRIDNKVGSGGVYTGPMLTGTPTANSTTTNLESDPMPLGMTVGTVQCVIVNIEETGQPGWRLPVTPATYAIGTFEGMSGDPVPVPIIMIRGALGDLNSVLDLPGGTFATPNPVSWDWNTSAQAFTAHPVTRVGYDGTSNAGGSIVTDGGSKKFYIVKRQFTVDARGVIRAVADEGSEGSWGYIQLQAITIGTNNWQISGGYLQQQSQTIYVFDYEDPGAWVDVVPSCS